MSRDAPLKAEKDYSQLLNDDIPRIELLPTSNSLQEYLIWEKKTRQVADLVSSKTVLGKIVDLLVHVGMWDELCEQLTLLSKKHGQLKLSIQFMIQKIMEYLDIDNEINLDLTNKVKIIDTIRNVTENKIFVEVERARVTRQLTNIKKSEGNNEEACKLLCELQVETYGSMEMFEKIEFILEQMELSILIGDYSQATVFSRKILKKTLKNEKYSTLKLKYYNLLIKIGLFKDQYLEIAQYYQEIYFTKSVKENEIEWMEALTHIVYFLILAPYGNLQNDLIHKIQIDHNLKKLEIQESIIKLFTTNELMRWPIVKETYEPILNNDKVVFGTDNINNNKHHWDELKKRVIEHNLRVISKYYSKITLARLNELLDLNEEETEIFISNLVNQGIIYAKVNRPAKIVNFEKPKNSNEFLDEWSQNVDELLEHIETIGHLITKEEIMYGLVE